MAKDPYSLVYSGLVDVLRTSPAVASFLSRTDNVIDFTQGRGLDQFRDKVKESGLPELMLFARAVENVNYTHCAGHVQLTRVYELSLSTEADKISRTVLPLEWAVTCAIAAANFDEKLDRLTWLGETFVQKVRLVSVQSGVSDPLQNRGIRGWAGRWTFAVDMNFSLHAITQYHLDPAYTPPS